MWNVCFEVESCDPAATEQTKATNNWVKLEFQFLRTRMEPLFKTCSENRKKILHTLTPIDQLKDKYIITLD